MNALVLVTVISAGEVVAFDGQRAGFQLGFGAGLGHVRATDRATADKNGATGLALELSLGAGIRDRYSIDFSLSPLIYSPSSGRSTTFILTATAGPTYYFSSEPTSLYANLHAGISFDGSRGYDGTPPLIGYVGRAGVGYVFGIIFIEANVLHGRRFAEAKYITILALKAGITFQ